MKNGLIENVLIGIFVFISLQFIIFPGLESSSILVNLISLISFCLVVIFALASVVISKNKEEE